MASIRKKPNSKYWYACYDQKDGQRTQVSTKSTDRKVALRVALQYEDAVREARLGVLVESSARKNIDKIYELAVGTPIRFYSIEGWLNWWLENKVKSKSSGTAARYKSSVKSFLGSIGTRATLEIRHLSPSDVEIYVNKLIASGKSNRTVNVDVKTINSAFNLAKKNGYIDVNPFNSFDSLPAGESVKKNFDNRQVNLILSKANGEWKGLILFGYYTGARISDLTELKWGCIDMYLKIPLMRFQEIKKQQKHRREIVMPLHPKLVYYLSNLKPGKSSDYIFPKLQPIGTGGNSGLSQSFRRILVNAEIVAELYQKKKEGTVGRTVSPYSFHSLRHSFKTELANKGVAADVRDVLSGHAKPSVAEGYVHRDTSVLMDAIKLLPDLKVA
jgi:integrase